MDGKICLETSAIIGFLKDEPDCQSIERILRLAEAGQVELFVSDFAWDEIYKPLDALGNSRKKRLEAITRHSPRVARLGEWCLGFDMLGHDESVEIEDTLFPAGRADREQFLSYAALSLDFFVTKDKHFLRKSAGEKMEEEYGFRVCTPDECSSQIA